MTSLFCISTGVFTYPTIILDCVTMCQVFSQKQRDAELAQPLLNGKQVFYIFVNALSILGSQKIAKNERIQTDLASFFRPF